jgi:dipeptidyl aminopeptidase/acylaminoacyl peptidase
MSLALAAVLAQASLPFAVLPLGAQPAVPSDPCARFDLAAPPDAARSITPRDLAEIADIGRSDPSDPVSPFGISPDGKQIAFVIRRGNPDANGHCQRLMVMPLDGSAPPREIDRGGALIREVFDLRNFTAISAGWARVITPRWSPDGQSIAYLKRTEGSSQVWLVDGAGLAPPRRATRMPDDIEDFRWTDDGAGLIVATRPGLRAEVEEIAREAPKGYLFDARFAPMVGGQPLPTRPHPLEFTRWNPGDGTRHAASPDEVALVIPPRPASVPPGANAFAASRSGAAAWVQSQKPGEVLGPLGLVVADESGHQVTCGAKLCARPSQLSWSRDGRTLVAVVRGGWARSLTRLVAWRLGSKAPRTLLETDDALLGCTLAGPEVVCAREGATLPRRIVAIDLASGKERVIFNPNPDLGTRLRLGKSQRLRFRNDPGIECFADLVLPPDHRPGDRHPLVVVQYNSVGFLRGGTGDEFPIQVLAARGFAVLSFNRSDFVPTAKQAPSERDASRELRKDWIDRRSVQSALETAVREAIATGSVDPDRMGISGFSDGSSTVQWALINSSLFKVAALGTCCEGPDNYALVSGPSFEQLGRDIGYRFFEPGAAEFWKPMSLAQNADHIEVPILVQTGDSEYQSGLDVNAAFHVRGKPFELHVLPDEGHVKWQPAHRLAMYERSTEWFEFWLMGRMNCDPGKAEQFARWRAMKGAPVNPVCGSHSSSDP